MKKIKLLSAIAAALLISCGGDDNTTTSNTNNNGSTSTTPIAGKFKKNVLIEDYTGTWCGYCPRIAYAIEQVEAQNIDAVPVAIHRGQDPYNFADAATLETMLQITGYPDGRLNRKTEWTYPEPYNINQVKNLTGPNSDLGIAMTSTLDNGNINLEVKTKYAADLTNLKLVVYLLEDGLVYNQSNYTSYYGGTSVISNMTHNHVLRAYLTNSILGDTLTGTTNSQTLTNTFSLAVPSNVTDSSKMSFVAFVVDASGKALNVRSIGVNETQTFQENM